MYRSRTYGEYKIFQEGDRFVAQSMVDDEAEELESHSVDGLVRMINEFEECLSLSNFEDARMPASYRAWDEAGRQGRIKDLVRQVPHVLFSGAGAFFVEKEQDNRPRVLRPESATILKFSMANAQAPVGPSYVKNVKKVDITRMRGPMPQSSLSRRLADKREWARYGRIMGRTAAGVVIPAVVIAGSAPVGPAFAVGVSAVALVLGAMHSLDREPPVLG